MPLSTREVFLILRARDEASRVLRDFSRNMDKVDKQTMKTAQAQAARGSAMSSVGVGLAAAGAAASAFFKTAVDSAVEYHRQAALTKTQTDKVVVSIEQLKDIGREVGSSIPTDFDHIQQSLYDIFSSMEVTLPQAKKLLKEFAMESVAGQENLQEAGKGTIGIMNAFKIPIENVRSVSDTMFQLVRKGVGTYVQFNRTIGRAVPSAVRAGQSFEDLAGMMAFLTRNGLSAAMAAASAGRALDAFSNPKVVGRLEKMGIAVRDAKGQFLPISDVVAALGKKLSGLTDPQRAEALQQLFLGAGGTIQARRFYDIAVKNYDQVKLYTDYMKNSKGAMQEAYDIMFAQPQSQAQLLSNNFKIMKTIIGDALLPAFVQFTGAIIKVLKWFNNLDPKTRTLIVKLAALASVLAIVIGGVLAVAGVIMMFVGAAAAAGIALSTVGIVIAVVIAAIIAIGVAIFFIIKYHKQIWAFMKKVWAGAVNLVKRAWEELQQFGLKVADVAQIVGGALADAWRAVVDAVIWFGKMVASVATAVGKWIWDKIGGPVTEIAGWFVDLGRWFAQLGKDIWSGIGPSLVQIWNALQEGVSKFVAAVGPHLSKFVKSMKDVWGAIKAFVADAMDAFDVLLKHIMTVLRAAGDFFSDMGRLIADVAKYIWDNGIKPLIDDIGPTLEWLGERFMDFLRIVKWVMQQVGKFIGTVVLVGVAMFKVLASVVSEIIPPVAELVGKVLGRIIDALGGLIKWVVGVFTGNWKLAWQGVKDFFGAIFGGIIDIFVGAAKVVWGIMKGFVKGIVDAAKWLYDKLVGHSIFPEMVQKIIYWFNWFFGLGKRLWDAFIAGLKILIGLGVDWIAKRFADFIAGVKLIWGNFWNALSSKATSIWTTIKQNVQGGINGIKTIFSTGMTAIGKIWDTITSKVSGPINKMKGWINSNLVTPLNKVTKLFGLTIPALATGGGISLAGHGINSAGRLARGGRVPGTSPNSRADNIPIWATAGEFMQPVQAVKYYGPRFMEMIRRRQIPKDLVVGSGWANGGAIGHGGARGYFLGGLIDKGMKKIDGWLGNGAKFASDKILGSATNLISRLIPTPEFANKIAVGTVTKLKEVIGNWATKQEQAMLTTGPALTGPGIGGGRRGAYGGVQPWVAAAGDLIKRMFGVTNIGGVGGRPGPSDHPSGHALDFMVGNNRGLGNRIASYMHSARNQLRLTYLIWYRQIASASQGWRWRPYSHYSGNNSNPTLAHMDHVHASFRRNVPGFRKGAWKILRDQMAYLHRGELVIPSAPAESIRRGYNQGTGSGSGNGSGNNFNFTINTQEIDPRKHAADLGWEFSRRVS